MADEFGGIAVDEPSTDEFGGVAVEGISRPRASRPTTTPDGRDEFRRALSQYQSQQVDPFKPFIKLPEDIKAKTLPGQILAAPYNVGKGILEGIESPAGVTMLPLAAAGKIAQAMLGAGFGIPAIKQGLERVYSGTALRDRQEAIEGALQAITGGLITAGGVKGAAEKPMVKSAAVTEPIIPRGTIPVESPTTAPVGLERPEISTTTAAVTEQMPIGAIQFGVTQAKWSKMADWQKENVLAQIEARKAALTEKTQAKEQRQKETGKTEPLAPEPAPAPSPKLPFPVNVDISPKEKQEGAPAGESGVPPPTAPATVEAKAGEVAPSPAGPAIAEPKPVEPVGQATSVTPPVTEPWKITKKQWIEQKQQEFEPFNKELKSKGFPEPIVPNESAHYWSVKHALENGKPVPTEVLKDYPELTPPVTKEVGPGMGGALAKGEIPETGAGGEKYGVRAITRAERAQAGQVDVVEPGAGTGAEAQVQKYREVVRADPTAGPRLLEAFEADPKKKISAELEGVTRAHGEALFAGARTIEERYGTDSPQYRDAYKVASDWDRRTKPIQTQWSEIGRGQQGETDIDTGSFTGLRRERQRVADKDFTPAQKPKAEKIAADNKQAQVEVDKAGQKLNKRIVEKAAADPQRAKVWELAKKYLDENKGLYGFDDLRNKIAVDLGMTPSEVTRLLAKDATTKRLADDLWNKQRNARRLKEQAKNWLRELDTPGYQKALASLPRLMFSLSVGGHGFVALGTHAPIVAFQPRFWNAYVRNFGKMYKQVVSPAYYESQMQDLVRRPNYEVARRNGLQNDPFKYEEFHTGELSRLIKGWLGEKNMDRVDKFLSAGNRGYGVLKLIRQDMFDQQWNKLPDAIKKQEGVAAAISDGVNHATGVTKAAAPKGSNIALFAPRLAGSRVMWLGGDPIRAANTIGNWKNATTAEKVFAINQMKEKAWVFGTFASLLAANQGFLMAAGSKQKINGIPESLGGAGFDPLASDFMKFKALGGNIAYGGALLTLAKLPARVAVSILYEGKGSKYILEDERVDKVIGSYVRSQMSPFAGTLSDLALGRDYEERPLPAKMFGMAEQPGAVPKRLQNIGVDEPYTWGEYAATKLPIPVAEGIKEGLRSSGMSDDQAKSWMKALAVTSLMTGTGTRITEDTREE